MNYQIVWDPKARDFLRKLNKPEAQRIIKKVNSIVDCPRHYLETLVDIAAYKLRAGDYRILIDLDETNKVISVILIGHRKDVYQEIQRTGFRQK